MNFSSDGRDRTFSESTQTEWDVLVIGGGITGAGIALDSASRGLKTILLEMQDFAAGTSSRSTKLVHGGLRYLKQLEVKMVAEVGKERAIVYENGPHVTRPEWMLLPLYEGGTFGRWSTSLGLMVYDYLAGVKRSERRKMLSAQETLRREPLLKKKGLLGGGYYVEYRTDDARLTIEVIKESVSQGATALNYAKVTSFIYREKKVVGAKVRDQISGREYDVMAKRVINASGPWVDTLREKDGSKKGKSLRLTKGAHLVINQQKFPLKQAVYFDTPDGRMVFAIPRDGKAYIGTTDTFFSDDPIQPKMTCEDRAYILDAIHFMFPDVRIQEKDIESSWAGVRPLIHEEGKAPSEISRKDEIWQSESGLITIAGGKLTGYRKMAEMAVDLLVQSFKREGRSCPACKTKQLPISGGKVGGSVHWASFVEEQTIEGMKCGLTRDQAKALASRYGSNTHLLWTNLKEKSQEAKNSGLPLDWFAALEYALTEEMTVKPTDFFIRRTGSLLFDIHSVYQWKEKVLHYMAKRLGWSPEQLWAYSSELERELTDAASPADSLHTQESNIGMG